MESVWVSLVPLPTPLDSRLRGNDDPGDSGDSAALSKLRNTIFVPIAHAGWLQHTKESRAGVAAWYKELPRRILPHLTPAPAGDKPLHYILQWTTRGQLAGRKAFRTWRARTGTIIVPIADASLRRHTEI